MCHILNRLKMRYQGFGYPGDDIQQVINSSESEAGQSWRELGKVWAGPMDFWRRRSGASRCVRWAEYRTLEENKRFKWWLEKERP